MGVLSAREDAEKVGYSIIGEKTEEASNVIDYNINSEITKDTSAVFNANNDTTTGMATVIPGVNAPKLIAQTSILGIDFNAAYYRSIYLRMKGESVVVPGNDEKTVQITTITRQDEPVGPFPFKWVDGKGIIIPTQGTYKLECKYYWTGGWDNGNVVVYDTMLGGRVVYSKTYTSNAEFSETYTVNATKGQGLMRVATYINNAAGSSSFSPNVWVTITKL